MIYVMSDIHGHRRRFDSVMKQINLQPEDTLYSCTGATLLEGKVWKSTAKKEELSVWADSLACR